ncbi:MAG: glutaredoxin domain-containing protein [Bacillota bacterium]
MIEIYTRSAKPSSKLAKAIFESRGCSYEEYDIDDRRIYREMLERTGGARN